MFDLGTYVASGAWYHVVVMRNGNVVRGYINGRLTLNQSNTSWPSSFPAVNIGRGCFTSRYFPGSIDDVRIYNRALSAQEVQQLYALGSANIAHSNTVTLQTGLVGYWPLDGGTTSWKTDTTQDVSGSGNTGALVNMSTTTSPVPGKIGGALKFNGSTQYINLGTPSSLNITGSAVTVSAWVKVGSYNNFRGVAGSVNTSLQGYSLYSESTGPVFGVGTGAFSFVTCADAVTNTWQLWTGVYGGGNDYLYINGKLCTSPVAGTGNIVSSGIYFSIGNNAAGVGQSYWNGSIDDVRIYNRALSAQEVAQLYAAGR